MAEINNATPWKNARQAGQRMNGRSRRFVMKEFKAGRLRAARIGGRGEILTRDEWIDEWIEQQASPVVVSIRRRA
jgi:hypothetical protein